MSETVDTTRALLRLFVQTGCKDLHVRLCDFSLFIARPDGAANPMRVATVMGATITAPHIATFVSALPVGTTFGLGDVIATIELLGEEIGVEASEAGTVGTVHAEAGQLIEYDAPILSLVAA